jgi:hypothetical protein
MTEMAANTAAVRADTLALMSQKAQAMDPGLKYKDDLY